MIKRIDTDLIANSIFEIDNLWRVVAHRIGSTWHYFGRLAEMSDQSIFRERTFGIDPTITAITGKDPSGDGYLLYARLVPPKILAERARTKSF